MTILVTGGTGTTGSALVAKLRARGEQVRVASRHPAEGVRFDWSDPDTFPAALDGITAVYLLRPDLRAGRLPVIEAFLARAGQAGVRRVAVLSSTVDGVPDQAETHEAIKAAVPEWALLRPSWFMSNFIGAHTNAVSIRERGEIATATGEGRIGFVDPEDIAAVAAHALTVAQAPNTEYLITGPEALSYAEVAATITEVTGVPVRHVALSAQESIDRWVAAGIPESMATYATEIDRTIAAGSQDWVTSTVADTTGRPAHSLREFVHAHRDKFPAKAAS